MESKKEELEGADYHTFGSGDYHQVRYKIEPNANQFEAHVQECIDCGHKEQIEIWRTLLCEQCEDAHISKNS